MSDSNRGDRGALVALGMGLIALVVVYLGGWLSDPDQRLITHNHEQQSKNQSTQGSAVLAEKPRFITARGDTLAQWIAALASLFSLIVSSVAVKLVRDTLVAAHESNEVAREIGHAQVRAYLGCLDAQYRVFFNYVAVLVRMKNYGLSPAINIKLTGTIRATNFTEMSTPKGIVPLRYCGQTVSGFVQHLAAGEEEEGILFWPLMLPDCMENDPAVEVLIGESTDPSVTCTVTWDDVFGTRKENSIIVVLEVESRDMPIQEEGQIGEGYLLRPSNNSGDKYDD